MNPSIRKVAAAVAVLFAALFVNLNVVQVVKGDSYRNNPQNARVLLNEYSTPRGQIIASGNAVAESRATTDTLKYLRVYPGGPVYAPVTGFFSLAATPSPDLGTTGIETAENDVLSGQADALFGTRLADLLTGRDPRGGSVELTIDDATQRAAYRALSQGSGGTVRRGAVVALDPATGAVLAAVSTPSYDPSVLSLHDTGKVTRNFDALQRDKAMPLLNRAFDQLYPPGSTFKIVDAAAALKAGLTPQDQLIAPNAYYPETGATAPPCRAGDTSCVQNFTGETCQNGKTASLLYAFAKSCNTLFSALAVEQLGGDALQKTAAGFGFGNDSLLQEDVPVATSSVGSPADLSAKGFLARTAIGQQDVRVTPLQDAMLAAAVADDGVVMQPYLVRRTLGPDLSTLPDQPTPQTLGTVLDPAQDHQLQSMMEAVVTAPEGTGHDAAIDGVVVGGKTGTAETGRTLPNGAPEPPDAWFTGYAMVGGTARIAVAVVIENGGVTGDETTGGAAAAPVARAVMQAYLQGHR